MLTERNNGMPTIQQLREQRANIYETQKAILDRADTEGRAPTADELAAYNKADTDYEAVDADITRRETVEAREKAMARTSLPGIGSPAPEPESDPDAVYAAAFGAWLRNSMGDLSPEHKAALRGGFQKVENAAGTAGSAGGYAVPPGFRDVFVETQKWFGPMLQEAEVIDTDSGANLQWPTNDDTGNVGAILAENTQVTEQDVTLGTASLDAYMYTSKLVRASYQLLQDKPDFDTWLSQKLGERVGRILNQHFTTGSGVAQPDGIVTSATVGVTGAGSIATTGGVSFDNIIDLTESLDPAYGNGAGMKFMGHQSVRKALRKVKDTGGRYVWEPSTQVDQPNLVYGYPFVLNNDMATVAVNSKSLLFGNIRQAYVIRIVKGLTVMRLNERYADYLQAGFLAFERADGTLQDGNAVRVFQTTPTA